MKTIFTLLALLCLAACGEKQEIQQDPAVPPPEELKHSLEPLIETIKWVMEQPKCKGPRSTEMSEVGKAFLAEKIERIITKIGGKRSEQEIYIGLICQESQFRPSARSSGSAAGLTQMILGTAQMEASNLKLGKITLDDLNDPEISITLGYTHFLRLVKEFNGNLARALAAYNGGSSGSTVKAMIKTGGLGAHETDAYVRAIYDMQEQLRVSRENMTVAKN